MARPLVSGISPREGCPGTRITIRGQNLGVDGKDFIGLSICGDDCIETAAWQSPTKIFAYAGYGSGQGDVIVTTKSGGAGTCSVRFFEREEQAGPFQEVALWVDEDAVALFGLNTLKNTAVFTENDETANETATDNSTSTLAEELYNLFPGCSTELGQSNFNPYYYLLVNKSNATLGELRQNFERLKQTQAEQKNSSAGLNKNHIAPFLEAVEKIKPIRSSFADDRKTQFYSHIIRLLEDIFRQTYLLYGTDLTRKDISDRIRNALNLIHRYKFIFLLPQTIDRCIQREEYDKAITDLVRARTAFEVIDSKIFRTIQRDVEQQIQYLRKLFQKHLKEFPSSIDDQKLFIHYIYLLDSQADPAWNCINDQTAALINALRSCTIDSRKLTHLQEQACDILKSAFSDLWHLIQLYLKRKLYPINEGLEQVYTHQIPEFHALTKQIIEVFIQVTRSNLLNSAIELSELVQTFPHDLQTCRLCVLHLISLDLPKELKSNLHELIFDLRFYCFQILIEHTCEEISCLNQQETWQIDTDEQFGSHTKLPDLFHDLVVTKADIIYENILTVNVAKGERKFFDDKQAKEQSTKDTARLLSSFTSIFRVLKEENSSNTHRLIILLNNLIYTRQFILPRLKRLFLNFGFRVSDEKIASAYQTTYEDLFTTLHDQYMRVYFQRTQARMYAGNFDWSNHLQVTAVSDYVKHLIFDLARVYAEVYSVSVQLAMEVSSKISSTILNELKSLYSNIREFNQVGAMQACLDILTMRECFGFCLNDNLASQFEEMLKIIPNTNEHIKSKELKKIFSSFVKKCQPY